MSIALGLRSADKTSKSWTPWRASPSVNAFTG